MVSKREFDDPAPYHIRVCGCLDSSRSAWFDDLEIIEEAPGVVLLAGEISDQCALYGILSRVRDLGLPLLSVERLQKEQHGMKIIVEEEHALQDRKG